MILDDIVSNKKREVSSLKKRFSGKNPLKLVEGLPPPRDFRRAFAKGKLSLIAEIKKASPSAGLIRQDFEPITLAKTYEESGASAISVLTDEKFFQGKLSDLKSAKESTVIPVLRKDFLIDELQVFESRIAGADAILLIVRILSDTQLKKMLKLAETLGMQALVEVHDAREVRSVLRTESKIIGINNRNLGNFKVDFNNTLKLIKQFPELKNRIIISESGVRNHGDVETLKASGVDGVLVGTSLLKSSNIPKTIEELMGG
ncbi:MAG: indole-3-glycerol phosphate synthase TrpC [Candidatus Saganbacteria bacterium]|nr:indole-3-glycerol phosphate synthase TrpC [Candidatus Saganbacteria bacterium]